MWKLILFHILLLTKSGRSRVPCLPPNEKCDCQDALSGLASCRGINSLPRNLPSTVDFLQLDSNPLGSALLGIQMENMRNLTLKQLYLSQTGLEAIESRAFLTQPGIVTLDLSKNNFKSLDGQIFYGLTQLNALFLTKSFIYEISSIVFTYTPALEYLDLAGNMLTRVSNQFSSLSNLHTLLIPDNEISFIEESEFASQPDLRRLTLYGNQLQTLEKRLFENLSGNNGTLVLNFQSQKNNVWKCCGESATEYQAFLDGLPTNLNSRQQYDVICSWPEKFAGTRIGGLDSEELKNTECQMTETTMVVFKATHRSTVTLTTVNVDEEAESTTAEFGGPIVEGTNMFNNLTNGHIVLIIIAAVIITIIITGLIVHYYHARARNQAFKEFVNNLPNSKTADSDDDAALTTKTYRHDVPVYGSTGIAVDRHMNGSTRSPISMGGDEDYSYDIPRSRADLANLVDSDSGPEMAYDTPRPQKRKPPPYNPPPISPDTQEGYQQTQFNNSSSVGLDYRDLSATRHIGLENFGYESDLSDDIWDASTFK